MSSEYDKLRKQWYARLAKLGFKDIEQNDKEERLKSWDSRRFYSSANYTKKNVTAKPSFKTKEDEIEYTSVRHKAKADYYYYAYQFLCNHRFGSEIRRLIWEQHVNGVGNTAIVAMLTKDKAYDTTVIEITKIINYYKKLMDKK